MLSPPLLHHLLPALLHNTHLLSRPSPLKWLIDRTFYPHYCTGDNPTAISRTLSHLHSLGQGIILSYARESPHPVPTDLPLWRAATLQTIALTPPHNFVALKLSGAGTPPDDPRLRAALHTICAAARTRHIAVLLDAEHLHQQPAIDATARALMREHNTSRAVVYNTYQMYLRSSPDALERDVQRARREGWVLGAKIVRGAYMGSDPRDAMWETKEQTDAAFDAAVGMLVRRGEAAVVVASHNRESVLRAREAAAGRAGVVYAQLLGMADELSLELVGMGERVVKYAVWGSTRECTDYLLRRVQENREVAGRAREEFRGLVREVRRRLGVGIWGAGEGKV